MKSQLMLYYLPCISMNPFTYILQLYLSVEQLESFHSGKERMLSIKYSFTFPSFFVVFWLLSINNFCFVTTSLRRLIVCVTLIWKDLNGKHIFATPPNSLFQERATQFNSIRFEINYVLWCLAPLSRWKPWVFLQHFYWHCCYNYRKQAPNWKAKTKKNTNQQQTIPHHILLLFKEKRFVNRKCRDQFCADQFKSYVSFSESSRWWLRRNLSKICIQILFSKFSSKSNHSHSNEKGTYIFLTYLCLTF